MAIDLLDIIEDYFNFNVTFVLASSWGHFGEDGTYQGINQLVQFLIVEHFAFCPGHFLRDCFLGDEWLC